MTNIFDWLKSRPTTMRDLYMVAVWPKKELARCQRFAVDWSKVHHAFPATVTTLGLNEAAVAEVNLGDRHSPAHPSLWKLFTECAGREGCLECYLHNKLRLMEEV